MGEEQITQRWTKYLIKLLLNESGGKSHDTHTSVIPVAICKERKMKYLNENGIMWNRRNYLARSDCADAELLKFLETHGTGKKQF